MKKVIYGIDFYKARTLVIESNRRYRKYKPLAHIASLTIRTANPVWIFLPYGFPSSAERLETYREGHYDLTDSLWVSI
jgi:hypothetical protein